MDSSAQCSGEGCSLVIESQYLNEFGKFWQIKFISQLVETSPWGLLLQPGALQRHTNARQDRVITHLRRLDEGPRS